MRVETHYFADDDTEFDTEEECLAYERTFKEQLDAVLFFTDDFEEVTSVEDIDGYGVYMLIKDRDKAECLFDRLGEYISFDKPDFGVSTGDVLQWTDAGWESIKDRIEELQTVFYKITEKAQKKWQN